MLASSAVPTPAGPVRGPRPPGAAASAAAAVSAPFFRGGVARWAALAREEVPCDLGVVRRVATPQALDGAVLEPDVAKRFKSSASVNKALRAYLKGSKRGSASDSTAATRKRSVR